MKNKRYLALSATCILLAFLLLMAWSRQREEALAKRIAPQLLRFHVLANSDSRTDQELKLEVRTLLLDMIYEDLGENASLEETKEYLRKNSPLLEQRAEQYMKSRGYDYPAHMELTNCYFPTKTYGDIVFPCGSYEAARLTIGSGEGQNWWCVLYPPLCFVDSVYAVVPDSSKLQLEESLGEQDYRNLLRERGAEPSTQDSPDGSQQDDSEKPKVRIRFKLLDMLNGGEEK